MPRLFRTVALTAGALLGLSATPASAAVSAGPAGARFYVPPSPLGGATHGDLVRARRLTGAAAVPGGAGTTLLLHRGTGVRGGAVAVSGALTIPKGKAPKGGWPVVSYAHGTTGLADECAPTRPAGARSSAYAYPTLRRWLERGWAVVRTDYEGLGTPGLHPYLVGRSEGRAVLDAVRAAEQHEPRLNTRKVLLAGHSQGGHAALWAASLAKAYTPELGIRGTVGFAPESHTGEQAGLISLLKEPSPLTALAASILAGIEVERPELRIAAKLTPRAAELYPRVGTSCLGDLLGQDAFGALAPADLLEADTDPAPIVAALSANDSETLTIRTPLRVEQGTTDTTVFPMFTDQLVDELRTRGTRIAYVKRPGVGHGPILRAGAVASTRWMAQRLK